MPPFQNNISKLTYATNKIMKDASYHFKWKVIIGFLVYLKPFSGIDDNISNSKGKLVRAHAQDVTLC